MKINHSSCRRVSFEGTTIYSPLCLRGRWAATLSPRIYLGNWIYVHTQQIAINKSNKRCDKHEQIYKFALEKAEKKKHKQNTHTQTAAKSAKQTNKTVRQNEIKGERGRNTGER